MALFHGIERALEDVLPAGLAEAKTANTTQTLGATRRVTLAVALVEERRGPRGESDPGELIERFSQNCGKSYRMKGMLLLRHNHPTDRERPEMNALLGALGIGAVNMKFHVYRDQAKQWRWRLVSANGQNIANCGESYTTKESCEHGLSLVKGSGNAEVVYD